MADERYNGSTQLLDKIDQLLQSKTITTSSAIRLMLEAQQHSIKENYLLKKEIDTLKAHWTNKVTPRAAFIIFFLLYSFAISDIRQPVMAWLGTIITQVLKLL